MKKILEILDGERVALICSIEDISLSDKSIVLSDGRQKLKVDNCEVIIPRSCFSIAATAHIVLPKQITYNDIKRYNMFDRAEY